MGMIRSLGAKLTGKRINSVVSRTELIGDRMPMGDTAGMVDEAHVCMLSFGDGDEPVLGVMCPDMNIDITHLKGVFKDGEVLDASVKDGCLVLTKGKDSYRFPLDDRPVSRVKRPRLDMDTEFSMHPKTLSKMYSKPVHNGYAKLVAGYDRSGAKEVRAFIYDAGGRLMDSVVLAGSWIGEESVSRFPMSYLKDIDAMGRDAKVRMSTDYPMELITDEEMPSSYLLAPRVEPTDSDGAFDHEAAQEAEWLASHNRKPVGKRRHRSWREG